MHGLIRTPARLGLILALLSCFSISQDVSEYEKRLNQLASQIESLRETISRERSEKTTVLSRLGRLGLQKKIIRNEIALFHTQRDKARAEIRGLEEKIPELEARLKQESDAISRILVTVYKFGRLSYMDLLLQTDNIASLLTENKHLTLLAQHQQEVISGYLATLGELQAARIGLQTKQQEIEFSLASARDKQQELRRREDQFQELVRQIDRNLQTHQAALEEQKDRAEQLQALIKKLLKDQVALPFPLVPLYEEKGRIPWPIPGEVISRFGNVRHPRFKTITKNNGIEIKPRGSMIVKAVHSGVVKYTDYFEGYGYLIIVDHGMAYYTLYGHCSPDFLAAKGDAVRTGQPIATIGDIESIRGTNLYFEIRYKSKALNPLQWLKGR